MAAPPDRRWRPFSPPLDLWWPRIVELCCHVPKPALASTRMRPNGEGAPRSQLSHPGEAPDVRSPANPEQRGAFWQNPAQTTIP